MQVWAPLMGGDDNIITELPPPLASSLALGYHLHQQLIFITCTTYHTNKMSTNSHSRGIHDLKIIGKCTSCGVPQYTIILLPGITTGVTKVGWYNPYDFVVCV